MEETLNSKYIFSRIIVSDHNRLAVNAAIKIAKATEENLKFLYVYGEVGLGKTHIVQAIANYTLDTYPKIKLRYITINNFVHNLIHSISNDTYNSFRDSFLETDLLIFDNIQLLTGKERTQEEFWIIVSYLVNQGKKIVVASTTSPSEMIIRNVKFSSLFELDAAFEVTAPDYNSRIKILEQRLAEKKFSLNGELISAIAEKVDSSIRELTSSLNRVMTYSELTGRIPTRKVIIDTILK